MKPITTFREDLLGLDVFATKLNRFIKTEVDYVEGSLVVALNAKYGAGKSTFLKMWKDYLLNGEDCKSSPVVISLNAWESDYFGDSLFAILNELVDQVNNPEEPKIHGVIEAAKDLGWFSTAVAGQVAKKFTGVDAIAAGDIAQKKKSERENKIRVTQDGFSFYKEKKAAMDTLKEAISQFVLASENGVLFLVDELDRCRPDYAISYLETIKHIFDIPGAVFVLAADRNQLENSAKAAFGPDLDFDEYYRKFIHREAALPKISDAHYSKLVADYVDYYLSKEGVRYCMMKLDRERLLEIEELIQGMKLTLRQIQEAFRVLGHVLSTSQGQRGRMYWGIAAGSLLMSILKVGNPKVYKQIGHQELSFEDAVKNFSFLRERDILWWMMFLFTGGGLSVKDKMELKGKLIECSLYSSEGDMESEFDLSRYHNGWGRWRDDQSPLRAIYLKIEEISDWN